MRRILLYIDKQNRVMRLVISLVVATVVFLLLRGQHTFAITFMCAWIAFAATTLFIVWSTILVFHPKEISQVASEQDTTRLFMFLFVVASAFISLFAIVLLLKSAPTEKGLSHHIILSATSVFLSWVLMHTIFTIRYAHLFYTYPTSEEQARGELHHGGLDFPATPHPDFLDFAYFAFVLGMTFQVADVNITASNMRRLALLHGFLAFVYNTIIVALSINIISGMIAK